MKARSQELVDKSIAAMLAAIEIYNKPDFKYREETFSILAINAWELLLKAKWLKENGNRIRSLFVFEKRNKPGGGYYKNPKVKLTECGNPFTHSLDFLAKKLNERGILPAVALQNIAALGEIRDSSVHFYNRSALFAIRLQEVGSASVKNFVHAAQKWFNTDLSEYNFYIMPLAFVAASKAEGVPLNKEEAKLAAFISALEASNDPTNEYSFSVNIDVRFSKSKANDALQIQITNDPNAPKFQLTDEQFKEKYPLNYESLTQECRQRYSNFLANAKYNKVRLPLKEDLKYCKIRRLDEDNPKSAKQEWYSRAVFTELDKHYQKRS